MNFENQFAAIIIVIVAAAVAAAAKHFGPVAGNNFRLGRPVVGILPIEGWEGNRRRRRQWIILTSLTIIIGVGK